MAALVVRVLVNAAALAVATALVAGVRVAGGSSAQDALVLLGVAVVFGLVNAVVRPIVKLLAIPLYVLTLGLIIFVINALMLLLTSWISQRLGWPFRVDGFGAAMIGALIVSLVSFALNLFVRSARER
jgi:putative membrane protein